MIQVPRHFLWNLGKLPAFHTLQFWITSQNLIVTLHFQLNPSALFNLFNQEVQPTPGQPMKEPMFIPVAIGLVDSTGKDMPLTSIYSDGMLQTLTSDGQPVFTTVLQFNKVKELWLSSCKKSLQCQLQGHKLTCELYIPILVSCEPCIQCN